MVKRPIHKHLYLMSRLFQCLLLPNPSARTCCWTSGRKDGRRIAREAGPGRPASEPAKSRSTYFPRPRDFSRCLRWASRPNLSVGCRGGLSRVVPSSPVRLSDGRGYGSVFTGLYCVTCMHMHTIPTPKASTHSRVTRGRHSALRASLVPRETPPPRQLPLRLGRETHRRHRLEFRGRGK